MTRYRGDVATPALRGPGRSLVPAAADPTPIVPSLLTSEDPVAGPAGPPEASSRRPSKLGRWRQDPRRRTRRLRRLPSSAGAGGGASPSSRDSGDPGGGGCDPCDVERSSPKAVWGRREGETRPPARAARGAPPPARRMRPRGVARRGRGLTRARARAYQTLPCPPPRGAPVFGEARHQLNHHRQRGGHPKLEQAARILPSVTRIARSPPPQRPRPHFFFSWDEPQAPSASAAMTFLPEACFPLPALRNLD